MFDLIHLILFFNSLLCLHFILSVLLYYIFFFRNLWVLKLATLHIFAALFILFFSLFQLILVLVWASSGIYCFPRLLYFRAVSHILPGSKNEIICLADRAMFDSRIFDTISFVLLYLIPLIIISVLYLRIARFLWVNNVQQELPFRRHTIGPFSSQSNDTTSLSATSIRNHRHSTHYDTAKELGNFNSCVFERDSRRSYDSELSFLRSYRGTLRTYRNSRSLSKSENQNDFYQSMIKKWQKIVKLLVAVVICFALCNLPYHLRKMLSYYYPGYVVTTNTALMAIPLTQVLTYLNSALNPILYCFMSDSFRFYIQEVLTCQFTWQGKRRVARLSRPMQSCQSQRMRSFRQSREQNDAVIVSKTEKF